MLSEAMSSMTMVGVKCLRCVELFPLSSKADGYKRQYAPHFQLIAFQN